MTGYCSRCDYMRGRPLAHSLCDDHTLVLYIVSCWTCYRLLPWLYSARAKRLCSIQGLRGIYCREFAVKPA